MDKNTRLYTDEISILNHNVIELSIPVIRIDCMSPDIPVILVPLVINALPKYLNKCKFIPGSKEYQNVPPNIILSA